MSTITRTELNQQTARALERVATGERLTITDRGRPIALLIPAPADRWDALVTAGRITPARRHSGLDHAATHIGHTGQDVIDDVRRDRG